MSATPKTAAPSKETEAFVGKVLGDTSSTMTVIYAGVGDRLGLFKALAKAPATSAEFARAAGIHERYAREWLGLMTTAGYVAYDPATRRFRLPEAHAPVLAQEGGPMFFGGTHSMMVAMFDVLPHITEAFRTGGGVRQDQYPPSVYEDMDRFTSIWHDNLLLQVWLPLVPEVQAQLERGAAVADVGCGRGRAIINMAKAYPKSTFVGFDAFEPNVRKAQEHARREGLGDRVRFEVRDVSQGLPGTYDLVATFDVLHDAADPRGIVLGIRQALKPGGTYLNLDINCSDKLEENIGPLGALFHGFSLSYCMTTSLANKGAGLGTLGLPPSKLQEIATEAGFRTVRKLPMDNPFNNLYALKA